jgi:hypothetical protein
MIKRVLDRVWAYDCEWVPDPLAARVLHGVPPTATAREAVGVLWRAGGATEDDPTPFLKTVLCRVVSIALVDRYAKPDGSVDLELRSLPRDPGDRAQDEERAVLAPFLEYLGQVGPQLVGYNSRASDLRIIVQRAVVNGLRSPAFCSRPERPWEGRDYFARGNVWHVDLQEELGSFGRAVPSLHEIASLSGIPGKMEIDGNQVAELWLRGELRRIVEYNEFDALTTYLLWLRVAHFAGHFTAEQYKEEEQRLRGRIEGWIADGRKLHLASYLREWDRLRALVEKR